MTIFFWVAYTLAAPGALTLGSFALWHLGAFIWMVGLWVVFVALGCALLAVRTLHGVVDGLLRLVAAIVAVPVGLGQWLVERAQRRRVPVAPAAVQVAAGAAEPRTALHNMHQYASAVTKYPGPTLQRLLRSARHSE